MTTEATSAAVRAIVAEYLAAHRQLETAGAHAEGEPMPMQPGPKLAAMTSAAARYAKAYQALAKLADAPAAGAPVPTPYNAPGHVCPDTGRLCMTVSDAYAREDFPDRHFWLYDTRDAENGMDPWRQVDGIDASTSNRSDGRPSHYSVDFANMRMVNVQPSYTVYMQRTKAEREALVRDWRVTIARPLHWTEENRSTPRDTVDVKAPTRVEAERAALATRGDPAAWVVEHILLHPTEGAPSA